MSNAPNTKFYPAGETIIQQGQQGDSAYIIEKGRVEILIEKDNGLIQNLGTRGQGSIIGEMAIIDNEPRTASVKTIEDSELLEITREDFNRRIQKADPVMRMIMQVILARYRDTIKRAHILGSDRGIPTPEDLEKEYMEETDVVETLKIGKEFLEALHNDQISLHYQPIIDISSSEI